MHDIQTQIAFAFSFLLFFFRHSVGIQSVLCRYSSKSAVEWHLDSLWCLSRITNTCSYRIRYAGVAGTALPPRLSPPTGDLCERPDCTTHQT